MRKVSQVVWNELLPLSPVFTTAEVAERASIALSNASRDLAELEKAGMVVRVRRGLWAVEGHPDFSPYAVVPHLFADVSGGYVSLLSALNLHGMIEQIPRVVQVVTVRQRPKLRTPVGSYEFYRIAPELYGGYVAYRRTGRFDIGTPEKALFDTLYFSVRKGRRFVSLPELEVPKGFSTSEVESWIEQIDHRPLRVAVESRWADVAGRRDVGA
jgi:predicted transcriptional regulator of viral defense system